jgi:hypothetical protein
LNARLPEEGPVKASVPLFVIAGGAGVWLALVLVVLRLVGIHIP